jgi:hypothetical protein
MKLQELTNIKIIEKQDKNLNTYYIIFNQDSTNEAYFCWEKTIKTGWQEFKSNWANIQRIEFEYEETEKGNKVINIFSHDQSLDIFV